MQTTLRIDDSLYRDAKAEAAREGITLTRFLESALRLRLGKKPVLVKNKPHPFPVFTPKTPLSFSTQELKKIDADQETTHLLRKLGKR